MLVRKLQYHDGCVGGIKAMYKENAVGLPHGPVWAAVSSWWLFRQLIGGQQHIVFKEASEQFGKFVRVGPNRLLSSDLEFLRTMFSVRSPYRRPQSYTSMRLQPDKDSVLNVRDEDEHQRMRAKLANAYNGKNNPRLEATIDDHITALINMIKRKYLSTSKSFKPLDFGVASTILAVDTATELALGQPIQDTASCDTDVTGYMDGMLQSLPVMQTLVAFPWLTYLSTSRIASRLFDNVKNARYGLGCVYGFVHARTNERYGPNKVVKKDILGALVDKGLSPEKAESEALLAAMAGADPVATAVRVNLLYTLTNPRVERTLRAELQAHGLMASNEKGMPSYQTLRNLPYLSAVVKESFRIFPPYVGTMEKQAPPQGDYTPDGRFIPGGTVIGANILAILRDRSTFGDDAEVFRPERWLEASADEKVTMDRSVDLCFSSGRYTCLGRDVAIMEIFKTVVELVRTFEMAVVDPLKGWESMAFGIFVQKGMWMRFEERG
ncbi:MAG: hypothetical protein Q9223_002827 [Gallowayella weberi]